MRCSVDNRRGRDVPDSVAVAQRSGPGTLARKRAAARRRKLLDGAGGTKSRRTTSASATRTRAKDDDVGDNDDAGDNSEDGDAGDAGNDSDNGSAEDEEEVVDVVGTDEDDIAGTASDNQSAGRGSAANVAPASSTASALQRSITEQFAAIVTASPTTAATLGRGRRPHRPNSRFVDFAVPDLDDE